MPWARNDECRRRAERDEIRLSCNGTGSALPLPLAGRAIAYGIFNESSLRTQGPIRRGLSFLHWSRGLLSLLRPGVMRPGVMMVWTAPYGIAMCQNEVVANLRQGSRP